MNRLTHLSNRCLDSLQEYRRALARTARLFGRAIAVILLTLAPATAALAHDENPTQGVAEDITIEERLNGQLPLDLAFRDDTGAEIELRRYFTSGKPVLLAFVYFDCAQLCPLVLEGLGRSLRVLRLAGDDYQVIAVSIDPAETPAQAAQQKTISKAGPSWHFLTGKAAAIEALTGAAGIRYRASETSGKSEFFHPANTLIVTPEGKISRYFSAIDFPPKDLRFALIEASGNRIGSTLDHLLMLCYRYDPAHGRYTVAILNILRGAALLTICAVGGFLGTMLLRERRTRTT